MDFSGISFSVETISPTQAIKMLAGSIATGKVDQGSLSAFERDMAHGRWIFNGAPIIISSDGRLLDGRVRLHACIRANAEFETLVVAGISAEAFETIDSLRKRTLGDVLSMRSEIHGRALASGLRIIWSYQNNLVPGIGKAPTPTALLDILQSNPEIRDSIIPGLSAMPLLPHGCSIAMHYLMSKIDAEKATQFISQIGQPLELEDTHPIVQLRTALQSLRGQGGARKQTYILAITFKSWNSFVLGKPIKQLKYAADHEAFPRLQGDLDWGPLSRFENKSASPRLSYSKLLVKTLMVTPDLAEMMLASRGVNRHVTASVINKYARDMQAGRWRLNGQTIKVGSDGTLIDGQHRLEAAKKARKAFPAIIVEGVPVDSINSLDIGRRRAVSDILREQGESHTTTLASALRWLWMIKAGVILAANSSPTNGELLELLQKHPEIRLSLRQVVNIREIMGGGIASALHCSFAERDLPKANEFFGRLIDGVQLAESSPVRHLRERLIRTRSSHRVRLAEAERVALTIKAWNSFSAGKEMQLLVWRNRGTAREALPAIQ